MSESPVPCRAPFAMAECERPLHHDGHHSASLTPPPHVSAVFDQAHAAMKKATRRADRWRWVFVGLSLVQIISLIHRILEGVPS